MPHTIDLPLQDSDESFAFVTDALGTLALPSPAKPRKGARPNPEKRAGSVFFRMCALMVSLVVAGVRGRREQIRCPFSSICGLRSAPRSSGVASVGVISLM